MLNKRNKRTDSKKSVFKSIFELNLMMIFNNSLKKLLTYCSTLMTNNELTNIE